MTLTTANGRLGNQIIRNLAVSLLAKKHNLRVNYVNNDLINQLGITLFSGNKSHTQTRKLTDENYFTVFNLDQLNYNLEPNAHYFQSKEITNFLYTYLHTDIIKSNIIAHNPYKNRYNKNNDLFIHIRLTDVAAHSPGITYYLNAIKNVSFDKLYIATDDKNHSIIANILHLYPSAKLIIFEEIPTFQFGSTCKHVILSHGSFSAVIGYLSFFSTVYYPEYEEGKMWYGDMFSINNWIKLNVK